VVERNKNRDGQRSEDIDEKDSDPDRVDEGRE